MTYYEELKRMYGYVEGQIGENEDGEKVIVSIDEESAEIQTLQDNHWIRVNIYYPDGTEEELYKRWFITQLFT